MVTSWSESAKTSILRMAKYVKIPRSLILPSKYTLLFENSYEIRYWVMSEALRVLKMRPLKSVCSKYESKDSMWLILKST